MTAESKTLIDLLESRADRDPALRAFTFLPDGEEERGSLTCAELAQQARGIAAWFTALGLTGERVLLLFPQGLEFIAAYFGCAYAGVVAIPAPMPHAARLLRTLPRLQGIVADAVPTAILTNREGLALAAQVTALAPALAGRLRWLAFDDCPWELAVTWRRPELSPEAPAHLQYTSGSTSTPKGTIITHASVVKHSHTIQSFMRYSRESRSVLWLPHFHDDGLMQGLVQPIYTGHPCLLMPASTIVARPERWLAAISRYRATHAGGPNFAYELCLRKVSDAHRAGLDLSSWVYAYNEAEPVRAETLRRFYERFAPCGFRWNSFAPGYGLAEATLAVSVGILPAGPRIRTIDGTALERSSVVREVPEGTPGAKTLVGCGPPVEDTKVAIVDPETALRCAPDRVGEIWIKSPCLAAGYLGLPEESERTFRARIKKAGDKDDGPYLRTGDLGFLVDGELFIAGRLKELIIIRGENRYPQDIEWTVGRCHPDIAPGSIAAFSVEVSGGERLVIAAEVRKTSSGSTDATWCVPIFGAIRKAVSEEHDLRPLAIVILAPGTLPKTSSGKLQRRACSAEFRAGTVEELARWTETPVTPAEPFQKPEADAKRDGKSAAEIKAWLSRYLATELRVSQKEVATDVPFSHYGLDSALGVRLAADFGDWLGTSLRPTVVWNYPSILALAEKFGRDKR